MTYRIAVCDDKRDISAYVASLALQWARARGERAHVAQFNSAEAFVFAQEEWDILLLDVEMGGMNGVELARQLRDRKIETQIIFVTAYPEHMAEGYEVRAVNYLLKPVDSKKLNAALDAAVQGLTARRPTVLLDTGSGAVRLYVDEIVCVEAFGHKTEVSTPDALYRLAEPISALEERLGNSFVRCHRSYLVNLGWISQITLREVVVDTGRRLPLSRRLSDEVRRRFIAYYRGGNDGTV